MNNFSWVLEDRLAGMARPDPSDVEDLHGHGITALVSLTKRPPFRDPPPGLTVLHLPVEDMEAPSQEQLLEATRFLEATLASGGRAAVHCVAGCGRTGTVLAAYLVASGEDPADAVHRVRRSRPGSIETAEQEHAVHLFAETLGRAARKAAGGKRR